MVIGMITVFLILFLVYLTGHLLIRGINRWAPQASVNSKGQSASGAIAPAKVAAITAAVEIFSEGTARIVKIEKE